MTVDYYMHMSLDKAMHTKPRIPLQPKKFQQTRAWILGLTACLWRRQLRTYTINAALKRMQMADVKKAHEVRHKQSIRAVHVVMSSGGLMAAVIKLPCIQLRMMGLSVAALGAGRLVLLRAALPLKCDIE